VIEFVLKRNNEQRDEKGILQEFEDAKIKESERYAKALKDFEEVQKKAKKGSKDPVSEEPPV
jgi:hypothetical protein